MIKINRAALVTPRPTSGETFGVRWEIRYSHYDDSKDWPHFAWSVLISDEVFVYKTGIRHVKQLSKHKQVPIVSTIESIVENLLLDSAAINMSWDDWCGDYGYSNDSLAALDIYRACLDSGKRLRRALGESWDKWENLIEEMNQ